MNGIYDNGEILLGKAKDILNYMNSDNVEFDKDDYIDIENDLKELLEDDEDVIVYINYDNGMGYFIDYWNKDDKVKESEEN